MSKSSSASPAKLTRPQHERIFAILRIIRERPFPNASTFMKELEVTRRTVMRDLDYLRDRMGMPIAYDPKERGYYLSAPVDHIPLLEMRASDLLWLFVGQHLLQQAADETLANHVRASFHRISDLFGSSVSICWDQLSSLLSAKTSGLGAAELQTFRAVSDGLARHRGIHFHYRKTAASPTERREVHPRHCAFVNGQWYLFAHDLKRGATRTFVLSRMSDATVTETPFTPGDPGEIPDLLRQGFGVRYSEEKPATVRIRVSSEIAHLIGERKWHPTQKTTLRNDGSLLLELRINSCRELTNWICSWGPLMEVLEPQDLRETVAGILRRAVGVYEVDRGSKLSLES